MTSYGMKGFGMLHLDVTDTASINRKQNKTRGLHPNYQDTKTLTYLAIEQVRHNHVAGMASIPVITHVTSSKTQWSFIYSECTTLNSRILGKEVEYLNLLNVIHQNIMSLRNISVILMNSFEIDSTSLSEDHMEEHEILHTISSQISI
jgi:hypothetical protein